MGGHGDRIDPNWNYRQLGHGQVAGSEAVGQIRPHVLQHAPDRLLHSGGRADHRIPRFQRRQQRSDHRLAGLSYGDSKEGAHEAVAPLLAGVAALPGRSLQIGRSMQQSAG